MIEVFEMPVPKPVIELLNRIHVHYEQIFGPCDIPNVTYSVYEDESYQIMYYRHGDHKEYIVKRAVDKVDKSMFVRKRTVIFESWFHVRHNQILSTGVCITSEIIKEIAAAVKTLDSRINAQLIDLERHIAGLQHAFDEAFNA